MAKVELQVEQWQERGIQVLVLLSFALQLVLLVLADYRRRIDSTVLRALVWSAYMLADSTAIYTLGHLSVTSRSSNHELMAFWAPFLLLHLGGQDNITAYAIEDNRLWLRHLQALAVQVAATSYVLYESTVVSTQAQLRIASILMFTLGVIKYGERVWALKRANASASGNKYRCFDRRTRSSNGPPTDQRDAEGLLRIAYLLLDVPKDLFQGPLPEVVVHLDGGHDDIPKDQLYKVVEMQLTLMHDVVYSKAEVIHTWYGLCIRVISSVFTAVAFLLFYRSGLSAGDHYSRADVVITYVLLSGAVILEIVSVLRAMVSRWPAVVLGKLAYGADGGERCMWGLLARLVVSLRRFFGREREISKGWWSDSMGQHNLIDLCVRSRASRISKIAGWLRVEDWWNTLFYSGSVPISTTLKELVLEKVINSSQGNGEGYYHDKFMEEQQCHIINSRGRATLMKYGVHDKLRRFMDMELDETILVWHIATNILLRWHKDQGEAEATEAISNYLLFLLAARPDMLPGSVSRPMYVDMCYCLTGLRYNTAQELTRLLKSESDRLANIQDTKKRRRIQENRTLALAEELARELFTLGSVPSPLESGTPDPLDILDGVWVEMLCYAGYKCRGYSHAKQLSNGGEFLTVAALVVEYYRRNVLKPQRLVRLVSQSDPGSASPNVILDEPGSSSDSSGEISIV